MPKHANAFSLFVGGYDFLLERRFRSPHGAFGARQQDAVAYYVVYVDGQTAYYELGEAEHVCGVEVQSDNQGAVLSLAKGDIIHRFNLAILADGVKISRLPLENEQQDTVFVPFLDEAHPDMVRPPAHVTLPFSASQSH